MIVDAQLHEPPVRLDWPALAAPDRTRLLSELVQAWLEAVGIDAAILFPVNELEWAAALSVAEPDRFAWVAMAGPPYGPSAAEGLAAGAAGVRAILGSTRTGDTSGADLAYHAEHTFPLCAREGAPVFVYSPFDLGAVDEAARRHPQTTFVLDHLGQMQAPIHFVDDQFANVEQLLGLARHDNLRLKLSAAPTGSREPYPFRDIWPHVRAIVDAFGAERIMWGSDISRVANRNGFVTPYPVEGRYAGFHTYAESLLYLSETELLTAAERDWILGRTARAVLPGWTP
jgi:L-fuconolactonase